LCEEEDSSLHENYPTSTSKNHTDTGSNDYRDLRGTERYQKGPEGVETGEVPQAVPISSPASPGPEDLAEEALELLRSAALREPIDGLRAAQFAKTLLAESEIGRLAIQVLEGGPHAARALVELAAMVSRRQAKDKSGSGQGGAA